MNSRGLGFMCLIVAALLVGPPAAVARSRQCVQTELCIRDFHWSPTQCACVPDGACATDAECVLFSDYCSGCDCVALAVDDPDPVCDGPGVRCLADPCAGSLPLCIDGQCTVGFCVDTQLCIRGFRWSAARCMCVPDRLRPLRAPHAPHPPHQPHAPVHP